MAKNLKLVLSQNKILKITALILGYYTWNQLYNYFPISQQLQIPISFYNVESNQALSSTPDIISIQVRAKSSSLRQLNDLALHINAKNIDVGDNFLKPTEKDLFLPSDVMLINYRPTTILIKKTIS